jgi:sulfane dehydrogenase subunit SoxC
MSFNRFIRKAPEGFLSSTQIREVQAGRRGFLAAAFAAAAGSASTAAVAQSAGESAILNLPDHTKSLGQAVAARGYGVPSVWEKNLQRRESPGLTRVSQSSVSFCPLQGLFGIITPSGLHFERHHQGWWDIDPSQHRLMVNGSDPTMLKRPMVFTMDELMRLPPVSRMHFIECGANTGMEWGNVAVPTVQYTHGHALVQRVHRRAAAHAARNVRGRPEARQVRAGRGR